MSKKKKHRPSAPPSARTRSLGATLADEKSRSGKRFNPLARNLLFGDLIFMAVCQLLNIMGFMSEFLSGLATLAGLGMLLAALRFQFGKKDINNSGGPGISGGSGRWPGL